jgi:phage major head subunit gpT-like protein
MPAQITVAVLDALRTGVSTLYQDAYNGMIAKSQYERVAMKVQSSDLKETYGWLKDDAQMRKWVGPRMINALAENGAVIENVPFEYTIGVSRYNVMFDKVVNYNQRFKNMGRAAAQHPDRLVWALLKAGFTTKCFDGQNFFDANHPIQKADKTMGVYANTDGGAGEPWFLIDTTQLMKPFIYQEAIAANFVARDKLTDDNVFDLNEFRYGVDMFCNAGYGLPLLCWGSRQPLTAANYEIARRTMSSYLGDGGQPLGIVPNLLVVNPTNEKAGKDIVVSATGAAGATNPWAGSAELLNVPWLA